MSLNFIDKVRSSFLCLSNKLISSLEKEHIRLEYSQRIQLLALFKQVKLGGYSSDKDTGTGYFDVVGADRRYRHCSILEFL